jgi:hypothetical protein
VTSFYFFGIIKEVNATNVKRSIIFKKKAPNNFWGFRIKKIMRRERDSSKGFPPAGGEPSGDVHLRYLNSLNNTFRF